MKNILIPTDFSKNAWNAIVYAMQFLKDKKCTIYFLHTYTPAFYRMDYALGGTVYSAIPDFGADQALAQLEKTLDDVKTQFPNPNHSLKMVSAFNTLTDEILELTIKKDIDLVIMGTQGATGAKQLFLGSNTVFTIRKVRTPILAIPNECTFTPIKKILFPSDFRDAYSKKEVQTIIEMARMYDAEITVLNVWEVYELTQRQEKNKDLLLGYLTNVSYKQVQVKGKKLSEAILDYIDHNDVDLLTMMNRDHSFFERVLTRQSIDQIGFHVQDPFLVVHDSLNVKN